MRTVFALVIAIVPSIALAQAPDAAQRKQTLDWVLGLESSGGGFYLTPPGPNADGKTPGSLRATNAAVRSIKYLGGKIPHINKHSAFVLSCFDPKTGGFAEPAGKPDVAPTSIGVMAAMELDIPKERFAKAMDYLKENAKTFEEVRIGAAAVEAWGVKDCPFQLHDWLQIASSHMSKVSSDYPPGEEGYRNGRAREVGSYAAFLLRLNDRYTIDPATLPNAQRDDGGWSKKGEKASDIETTYRVMRALMLLKEKPKDVPALRKFIASRRNPDGGYGVKPSEMSSANGVYFAAIITKWLDDMDKR